MGASSYGSTADRVGLALLAGVGIGVGALGALVYSERWAGMGSRSREQALGVCAPVALVTVGMVVAAGAVALLVLAGAASSGNKKG